MHQLGVNSTTDAVVAKPVAPAPGAARYYDDGPPGTIVDPYMLNSMMVELVSMASLGFTLDPVNDAQISDILGALFSHATSIVAKTCYRTRALLASTTSGATGANSAAVASLSSGAAGAESAALAAAGCNANGDRSAAIASTNATINAAADDCAALATSGSCSLDANAQRAAAIASNGCKIGTGANAFNAAALASLNVRVDANRAAVIASEGVAAAGDDVDTESPMTAIIACKGTAAARTKIDNTSARVLIAASEDTEVNGGTNAAALACITVELSGSQQFAGACDSDGVSTPALVGDTSVMLASRGKVTVTGARAAAIACDGTAANPGVVSGTNSANVGCKGYVTNDDPNVVFLGSDFGATAFVGSAQRPGGGAAVPGIGGGAAAPGLGTRHTWFIDSAAGTVYADAAGVTTPADYAELFENETRGVIGRGLLVARRGMRVATAGPLDRVCGVVSTEPSHIGNAPMQWPGAVMRDEFGGRVRGADGALLPSGRHKDGVRYVPRRNRPAEWTVVGLLGQIPVRVDDTVRVDDFVEAGPGGVGARGEAAIRGSASIECMAIVSPFDADRGFGIALCLVR